MLTLLLFRHAKAEAGSFSVPDIDRPLAPRGRTDAPLMGAWLARNDLVPDYIVCSTSRRTRETLLLAASTFGIDVETRYELAIYEASVARLLTVIRRTPPRVRRLMLVGHNPGFEDLAKDLVATADPVASTRIEKKYPTSGLAVLNWPKTSAVDTWAKLTPRSGRLEAFVAPRYLI